MNINGGLGGSTDIDTITGKTVDPMTGADVNYAMYKIQNNAGVTVNINNVTIKDVGAYLDTSSSVAYVNDKTAKLNLTNVILQDNLQYAIRNLSGQVTFNGVKVLAATVPTTDLVFNEIRNESVIINEGETNPTPGMVFNGSTYDNLFETRVTNSGYLQAIGKNTFKSKIANTGTIQFSGTTNFEGTEDSPVEISVGSGGSTANGTINMVTDVFNLGNYSTVSANQNLNIGTSDNPNTTVNLIGGTMNLDAKDKWYGVVNLNNEESEIRYTGLSEENSIFGEDGKLNRGLLRATEGKITLAAPTDPTAPKNPVLYVVGTDEIRDDIVWTIGTATTLHIMDHPTSESSMGFDFATDSWVGSVVLERSYLRLESTDPALQTVILDRQNMLTSWPEDSNEATLHNTGVDLILTAPQAYNGTYFQTAGTLTVGTGANFFGEDSVKQIDAGTVDVSRSGEVDFKNVILGDNTLMTVSARGGDINSDVITRFDGAGAEAKFYMSADADENDQYTLYHIEGVNRNTITVGDATTTLPTTVILGYNAAKNAYSFIGNTIYAFEKATVDLTQDTDHNNGLNLYRMSSVSVNDDDVIFKIDVDLTSDETVISDRFNFDTAPISGEAQTLNIQIKDLKNMRPTNPVNKVIQIITTTGPANMYQLSLDKIPAKDKHWTFDDYSTGTVDWDTYSGTKDLDLYTTTSENDSIIIVCDPKDTLRMINMAQN